LHTCVLQDGVINADETTQIRTTLYDDGVSDSHEAHCLFALNDAIASGDRSAAQDADWTGLFVETLNDYVLKDKTSKGTIDDDKAAYLMQKIGADGQLDANELALLVKIAATATGESPATFNQYTLDAVQATVIADGIVDAEEVEILSKVIYRGCGAGGGRVAPAEADMLFAINDATTDNEGHDAGWQALFVEALGKFVLDDEKSPGVVDEEEGDYLIAKIGEDGKVDANEKALMNHIKANANSITGKFSSQITIWAD
jgi:hypothetical protein